MGESVRALLGTSMTWVLSAGFLLCLRSVPSSRSIPSSKPDFLGTAVDGSRFLLADRRSTNTCFVLSSIATKSDDTFLI